MDEVITGELPVWRRQRAVGDENGFIPNGFPIIFDELTSQICQPTLFTLQQACLSESGAFVENTANAYSQDLLDWMRFLTVTRTAWSHATWSDLSDYVGYLKRLRVPQSGESYKDSTINRRLVPIVEMYRCKANRAFVELEQLPKNSLFIDRVVAEFVDDRRKEIRANRDEKYAIEPPVEAARILQPMQVQGIVKYLAADADSAGAYQTAVFQIAVDIAVNSGLRLFEVCGLRWSQFSQFMNVEIQPARLYHIRVRRKGGKIKPIRLHGYLIQTILDYARSEREQIEGVKEPYLLLNASGRLKGRRISRRTLQRRFAAACIAVGAHVVREAVGHDGVAEQVKVHPAFTFHDLRHTFAVWSYWALKEAGDDAPWKTIQEQLGHENVAVTINTYLAVTSALESVVSDEYVLRLKAIANSQTSNLALH